MEGTHSVGKESEGNESSFHSTIMPTVPVRKKKMKRTSTPKPSSGENDPKLLTNSLFERLKVEPSQQNQRFMARDDQRLEDQVKTLRRENLEMKEFIRDVLYTLNARGYETITDSHGGLIDLNRCRGDHFLELKGRDARANQHCSGKRVQAQEQLLKAVIGSQEKLIRSLLNQLNSNQRTQLFSGHGDETETQKSALLEREIVGLMASMEAAFERRPGIYSALKEQVLIDSTRTGGRSGILASILARHEQTVREHPPTCRTDESRVRSSCRRKLMSMERKRSVVEETYFAKSNVPHEKYSQRPPTPGLLPKKLTYGPGDNGNEAGSFFLRPVTSSKNLLSTMTSPLLPTSSRPATSITEYSTSRKTRGVWSF